MAVGLLGTAAASAQAAAVAPTLGGAGLFAVLGGSGLTNTGVSTVGGDVGSYPTPSETGFGACPATNCVVLTGTNEAGNKVSQQGKTDLTAAYNTVAGEAPTASVVADLGGKTLTSGVYHSASSLSLTGPVPLTLDGGGKSGAVFVFQAGTTLTTGSGSAVVLVNGAQSCNVFWQVGSSATLGSGSTFRGTILASASISVDSAATVDGRLLAGEQASGTGAVTLIGDTISSPACAASTPPPSPSPTPTTTTTVTPTPTASVTVAPTAPTLSSAAPGPTTTAGTSTQVLTPTTSAPALSTGTVPTGTTAAAASNAAGQGAAGTAGAANSTPTSGQAATSSGTTPTGTTPTSLRVNAGGGAGSARPVGPAVRAGGLVAAVTFGAALAAAEVRRRRRGRA